MKKILLLMLTLSFLTCSHDSYVVMDYSKTDVKTPPVSIDLDRYKTVQKRNNQNNNIAFAVAISGGGYRAANFGMGCLKGLESITPAKKGVSVNGLMEIDYFSTVSGGGFAAAAYLSTLKLHADKEKSVYSLSKYSDNIVKALRTNLELSFLLLDPECWSSPLDRGDVLEKRIDNKLFRFLNEKELILGDVFIARNSTENPLLPMWVANGTLEKNCSLVPLTPDILEYYNVVGYTHRKHKVPLEDFSDELSFNEIKQKAEFKDFYNNIPYALMLKTSASFPGLIAETTFRCARYNHDINYNKYRYIHILDGGVCDNLGYRTALELLNKDRSPQKVLIIIDVFNDNIQPYDRKEGPPITVAAERYLQSTVISKHLFSIEDIKYRCSKSGIKYIFINLRDDSDLSDDMRQFETRLSINDKEQEALYRSGERMIKKNEVQIKSAFGW